METGLDIPQDLLERLVRSLYCRRILVDPASVEALMHISDLLQVPLLLAPSCQDRDATPKPWHRVWMLHETESAPLRRLLQELLRHDPQVPNVRQAGACISYCSESLEVFSKQANRPYRGGHGLYSRSP